MSLDASVIDAFQQTASAGSMAAAISGMVAGGLGFAALLVPTLSHFMLPSAKETRLADHLPFDRILPGGSTVVCRDGTLVRCLKVDGRDVGFLPPEERERLFMMRKQWIDTLAETSITVRIFVIRDKADLHLDVEHTQPALRAIATRWNGSFRESYKNQQVIVLSIKGGNRSAIQKLDEASDVTQTILSEYRPIVLNQHNEDPNYQVLPFWSRIASPVSRPQPQGTGNNVSDTICSDTVIFDRASLFSSMNMPGKRDKDDESVEEARKQFRESGLIRFNHGEKEMFCSCVGIRALSDYTSEAFVADITSINGEVVLCHIVEPYSRIKAAAILDTQGRMSLAQRLSLATAEQFELAKDMVEGSDERAAALAQYAMMIFCYGETMEDIQEIEQEIKKIASWHGYTPVREGAIAQASWFAQYPSYPIWPRAYKLFSRNVVSHVLLDKQPEGLRNSDWGPGPIAMFRTATGTPYSFQFHVTDEPAAVAHAVAIAPTGGGKTTLVTFLAGMAMRHKDLRVFIIDRHGGAYIFTKAVGGNYVVFDDSDLEGNQSALNPFQMENNRANKSFLRGFLEALANVDNDPEASEEIAFAVNAAFDTPGLPKEQRSLANIYDAVFSKTKNVRQQLYRWVDPNQFGDVLNAPVDNLDLTSTRLVTFDFTKLYQHEDLARAVILYLMHRIQATITELNVPALIFIDETEPVVQHPIFRKFYLQMLQEFRKRRTAVISAFQRPEAISKAGLGEVIRGQAQTTFFMPNPQGQEDEYATWYLTDNEMAYVKGKGLGQRLHRSVLVKRAGGESVILDTDLSPLGPLLRIFRSDDMSKKLAMSMMQEYGEDWLHYYVNYRG